MTPPPTELYREDEGTGDPILLIHGNGANTRIWGRSADDLAATHRVIAYDRRGFGRTGGPPAAGIRRHVSDAAELLGELDAAPATVVGWSGGGVVAAALAADHPELVGSLVLEEAALHMPLNPTFSLLRSSMRIEYARRLRRDDRAAAQAMFDFALSYRAGGTQFERFPADWQESMIETAPAVVAEIEQLSQPYPSRDAVASISCPVTLLQGGLSEGTFHKVNRYIQRRLPKAHLVEIEGAAHAIHFDRPDAFREAVVRAASAGKADPGPVAEPTRPASR